MLGKKLCFSLMFIFLTQFVHAQLGNFTLTVTKTDVLCTSNGSLNFSVSNTTPGATMLYSIFLLPDVTTPLSVQSATSISGLAAGNYRVVATQSLGGDSGTQQRDITIVDTRVPLTYQISSTGEVCGNDATLTVSVVTGTAVSYEIFAGPMTRPSQPSNVFTGLTAGVYQVRVRDNCNQNVVQTHTIHLSNISLNLNLINPFLAACDMVTVGFNVQSVVSPPTGVISYPLHIVTTVNPPSGPPITYSQTMAGGNSFSQAVPLYPNQTYTYSFAITDGCGRPYTLNGTIQNLFMRPVVYTIAPQDCTHKVLAFSNVGTISLVSAPAGYAGTVPFNFTPQIENANITIDNLTAGFYTFNTTDICGNPQQFIIEIVIDDNASPPFYSLLNQTCIDATLFIYEIANLVMVSAPPAYTVPLPHDYTNIINAANYAPFVHLPVGTYIFNVVDRCGNHLPMTVIINPNSPSPTISVLEGCENNFGSVLVNGQLATISLIAAPAAYNATLPLNLTGGILANGTRLPLDMLPAGTYTFQSTNACNQTFQTTATISGYQDSTNATITANCGSFNFNLQHSSNNNASATFWLQKLNTVTNRWGHPLTGAVYNDGTVPTNINSFAMSNNTINYNLAYTGHFRILKVFNGYIPGHNGAIQCFRVIYEFDFSGNPKINDIYSISCGSTFEVVVDAEGNSALTYRIITKNGAPFLVQNGNSGIFSGLEPAIYVFEVEDACHNTVNGQFEVLNPNPMQINANSITCDGQSLTLTVPNFAFLTYQWWKGSNTATVLSTTNSLNFPSFASASDNGIYHVRITYSGNPNSCLNQVLNYTVNINSVTPHAGNDNTVSYCGRQGIMDLSTLLTGTFDAGGTWTEITSSGTLTGNSWDSSTVEFGTYQFQYKVTGSCDSADEAQITITIKDVPQTPVASADPIVCELQDLNLFATTVANATYHWTGPNGFASTLQNPTLDSVSATQNGTYTVNAIQNNCTSGTSSVAILVNPLPVFTISQECAERQYQVTASYDGANPNFAWTGPNGFTANQNPIVITGGQTGVYSLTVTNEYGCEATNTIDVVRTLCFIPNVITPNNDQTNENLDLTGFGVTKLEIYSRWGRKVYEKNNYLDEWHGQNMDGGILPDSTYYYIIEFDSEETKTGWIFLSRG
ncbi:MAG: gliding motility-associated C-terminal domain-containing protein [Phycisphaerales bacterium]